MFRPASVGHEVPLPDTQTEGGARAAPPPSVLALVVALCADEPERAGEVAIPPPGDPGPEVVWGRAASDGEERRLVFQRHRPGRVSPRGELSSPKVSRAQLRVRALGDRAIAVARVGRAPLLHNGDERDAIEVRPGDVLEIGRQIVLLCVRRPAWLDGSQADDAFPFGAPDRHGIVGESAAAWELRRRIAFAGPRAGHALVLGPSGSGKELVARALHARSSRAGRALVARSAATIPEGLVDAELFGNIRNYPSTGVPERPGMIGEADGSTLFLDEIGEISTTVQAHLLRLMDHGEYHRLGEARARRADVRLVCATNRPESALKHDLAARFSLRIAVPGLDERPEDIPLVVSHLLRRMADEDPVLRGRFFVERDGQRHPRVSPSLMRLLLRRSYPTNVRELQALLWEALADSPEGRIEAPLRLAGPRSPARSEPPGAGPRPGPNTVSHPSAPPGDEAADGLSPAAVQACLDAHNGVLEEAWRALGLSSRHALARLIKRHGLEVRRRPR